MTLFSAPNYCGEFDNAGAMMSVDETLMCSFQILKVSHAVQQILCMLYCGNANTEFSFLASQPADKRKFTYGGLNAGRPVTPPRGATNKNKKK